MNNAKKNIVWRDRKRLWCGLPWTFTVYSLSDDRFFIKRGFLSIQEDEVRLYRIKDLSLKRSLGQRIFGLGTIRVCSSDSTLRDFEIKNIKNSENVKELFSEYVEKERDRKHVSMREFMGQHAEGPEGGPDMDHDDNMNDDDDDQDDDSDDR